jgi:hypothetical protein
MTKNKEDIKSESIKNNDKLKIEWHEESKKIENCSEENKKNEDAQMQELTEYLTKNVETKVRPTDLTIDDILINLTLISRIEVGNKLILSSKYINIDTSYFQFFTRWVKNTNRNETLTFINMILSRAFEFNDRLLLEKTDESSQLLLRLNNDLKNSINGLNNLKQTYCQDKLIQSEIEVMIDNIRCKIDINSKSVKF